MKVKLDPGAYLPERAHVLDAGYDLRSREDAVVPAFGYASFDTGVHVEIPRNHVGLVTSKSGLMLKGLTSRGTIDSGYTGSIRVVLVNHSSENYTVFAGDKISQLIILPIETPDLEIVDYLKETERGSSGFGSTGR